MTTMIHVNESEEVLLTTGAAVLNSFYPTPTKQRRWYTLQIGGGLSYDKRSSLQLFYPPPPKKKERRRWYTLGIGRGPSKDKRSLKVPFTPPPTDKTTLIHVNKSQQVPVMTSATLNPL